MKLALIPPYCKWDDLKKTDYHLILPENVYGSVARQACVADLVNRGDYIILDNGVAEGQGIDLNRLFHLAGVIHANEIVIPDVMGSAEASKHYLQVADKHTYIRSLGKGAFKYMVVAQGDNYPEVRDYVMEAINKYEWITTIGLPRHLLSTLDNNNVRLALTEFILNNAPGIEIHWLGTNPRWIEEVRMGNHYYGDQLRGVDTSAPYQFAHLRMSYGDVLAPLVVRADNYFDAPVEDYPDSDRYVDALIGWVNG